MANLTKEYIDIKDIRHKVDHQVLLTNDKRGTEQIIEELFQVLTKRKGRPISA